MKQFINKITSKVVESIVKKTGITTNAIKKFILKTIFFLGISSICIFIVGETIFPYFLIYWQESCLWMKKTFFITIFLVCQDAWSWHKGTPWVAWSKRNPGIEDINLIFDWCKIFNIFLKEFLKKFFLEIIFIFTLIGVLLIMGKYLWIYSDLIVNLKIYEYFHTIFNKILNILKIFMDVVLKYAFNYLNANKNNVWNNYTYYNTTHNYKDFFSIKKDLIIVKNINIIFKTKD